MYLVFPRNCHVSFIGMVCSNIEWKFIHISRCFDSESWSACQRCPPAVVEVSRRIFADHNGETWGWWSLEDEAPLIQTLANLVFRDFQLLLVRRVACYLLCEGQLLRQRFQGMKTALPPEEYGENTTVLTGFTSEHSYNGDDRPVYEPPLGRVVSRR